MKYFSLQRKARHEWRHLQTFLDRRTVWNLSPFDEYGPNRPDRCSNISDRWFAGFRKRYSRERTRHWGKYVPGGRCPGCHLYIGDNPGKPKVYTDIIETDAWEFWDDPKYNPNDDD